MKSSYHSVVNVLRSCLDDNVTVLTGQSPRSWKELCPHAVDGSCYKPQCRRDHSVDAVAVLDNPKLGVVTEKEEITVANDLPIKPVGREGMMNRGIIVEIVNPGEFYLFPLNSWECACKEGVEDAAHSHDVGGTKLGEGDLDAELRTYADIFHEILTGLGAYVEKHQGEKSLHYAENQLVAVKLKSHHNDGAGSDVWLRGVVLEDVYSETDCNSASTVRLKVLDTGSVMEKPLHDVIKLPKLFCHVPPLVYKCALFGISPVGHRWTKSATATFKMMAGFQPCIYELKRTIPVGADGPPQLFENEPYEMDINVKIEGTFYNAAHALASEGLALRWNLTPTRPLVAAALDGELWNLLAAENGKPGCSLHSRVLKPDNQNVITRETNRLEKLLGRLSVGEGDKGAEKNREDSDIDSVHTSTAEDVMFK